MNYEITNVHDHVEVYDTAGNFIFSADTQQEAMQELRRLEAA